MRIVANPSYLMSNRIDSDLAERMSKSQDLSDLGRRNIYTCLTSTDSDEVMKAFDDLDLTSQYIVSLVIDNTEHEIKHHLDFIMSEIKSLQKSI